LTESRLRLSGFWARPPVDRQSLRQFTRVIAGGLVLIGIWAWHEGNILGMQWLAGAAGLFLVLGLIAPVVLQPLYVAWMYLARVLGWVNTRILLGLLFYTLFTVIGLGMRLFGRDPLDRGREPGRASCFVRRDRPLLPREHYERQF
jgi:hypothetical protein